MLIGIPHPALCDSKIRFCYWRTPGVRWGYLCCLLSLERICPINHVLIFFICLWDPLCDQMSCVQVGTPQTLLGKFPRFWVALLVHLSPLEKGQPTLQVTEKIIASFPLCEIWWGGHGFDSVHVLFGVTFSCQALCGEPVVMQCGDTLWLDTLWLRKQKSRCARW